MQTKTDSILKKDNFSWAEIVDRNFKQEGN